MDPVLVNLAVAIPLSAVAMLILAGVSSEEEGHLDPGAWAAGFGGIVASLLRLTALAAIGRGGG
jgi:hypothetical protein